jgi:hypothetical protein
VNLDTMQNLLIIAAAPVIDLDAPLNIEVTAKAHATTRVRRWKGGRHWAAYDETGKLIAVVVYKKGAQEIIRRLTANNQ